MKVSKVRISVGQLCLLGSIALTSCATQAPEIPVAATPMDAASTAPEPVYRPFPDDSFYDLLVAEFALRSNRFDMALGNYMKQSYHTRDPGVAQQTTRLAKFLGAETATLDAATLWTELEPDNLEAQYTLATSLAKKGRSLEAMQAMQYVLEQGGESNFAVIAASALPQSAEQRQQLEQQFQPLLDKYPDNPQLLTGLALLVQQRGEPEQALNLIQKAIKQSPNNINAALVETRLLQQLGRENEALTRIASILRDNPSNRRLRLEYARQLMRSDLEGASQQFKLLLDETPNDPDLLFSMALISRELGQLQQAGEYFKQLAATGQRRNEANFYLGQIAEQQQQWTEAIDYYQQLTPSADFIKAHSRIAWIYSGLGQLDQARNHLAAMRTQYPESSDRFYLVEAEILLQNQRPEQAEQLLTNALSTSPDQSNLLYARAMISQQRGNMDAMEQDLRQILQREPNNVIALNTLGYTLADRNVRLNEAYQLIQQAISLKPGDPAIMDSLAWVEFRLGNIETALDLLQQAYAKYPDPEVAAHLGEVLWQLNRRSEAHSVWKEALERDPDNAIIQRTMQRLLPDQGALRP